MILIECEQGGRGRQCIVVVVVVVATSTIAVMLSAMQVCSYLV